MCIIASRTGEETIASAASVAACASATKAARRAADLAAADFELGVESLMATD